MARLIRRSSCSSRGSGRQHCCASFGIPVIADMPGIGADLQDHLQIRMQYRCTEPITMNDVVIIGGAGWVQVCATASWRKGLLAVGAGYAGGFFRAKPRRRYTPTSRCISLFSARTASGAALHPFPGFIASVCQLRPESRGFVHIKSADPRAPPAIQPRYLSARTDRDTVVAGMKLLRRSSGDLPCVATLPKSAHPIQVRER